MWATALAAAARASHEEPVALRPYLARACPYVKMVDDDPDGARRPTKTQVSRHSSGTEPTTLRQRLRKFVHPAGDWPMPINPAVIEHERRRAEARQNRAADAITAFSGSMLFVYVHVVWFGDELAALTKEVRAALRSSGPKPSE